ncbi:MAG: methyltransferase domain-containing protein [Bacteroidetes bacterium]|nr:methyltransferase domain-containing protein [Bacteroidota bacterium]
MQEAKLKWKLAQTLEYKWWQNYLKNKDVSTYLDWKLNYWKDFLVDISSIIETPSNKTILDAGCGPAGIFMALDGNKVTAIDPLLDKYATLEHYQQEKYPYTTFIQSSIEAYKEQEKFDIIYCLNAINHVNEIELCYDNLIAALKPNGYLIISTDAHRHQFLKKIFQLIPGDVLHPIQFDIDEYNHFLTKRGLTILSTQLKNTTTIFNYYITVAKKII